MSLVQALEIDVCFHLLAARGRCSRALGHGFALEFQIEQMWKTITNSA
jgi:hypothetical protein